MKKGLIELRTGRKYTPGLPKEEYADVNEVVYPGFDVDYESFVKEGEERGENGTGERFHSQKNRIRRH